MVVRRLEDGVGRAPRVALWVDGARIEGFAGEALAVALLAAGHSVFRRSPKAHAPRGPFCMMGACQECVVRVDGRVVQACLVPVREGMEVTLG